MNLRLEKSKIRVRVSYAEALRLSQENFLEESYSLPGSDLAVELKCIPGNELVLSEAKPGVLGFCVPQGFLESVLDLIENGRPRKVDMQLSSSAEIGSGTTKISFEIDEFTISKTKATRT